MPNPLSVTSACTIFWTKALSPISSCTPPAARQGIAACLMQEVIRYAEEHDISRIVLEVRPSNEAAIALYEKFGFELDGRRPGFYDSPKEDALLYSLKL